MTTLQNINSPADLKRLSVVELKALANEIRMLLVRTVSKTGGHLASNLGVVELTLALHYCYDAPADKIVWDVGHQTYVHKLLTGRRDRFDTLRRPGGLSGFPRGDESPYDCFNTGHASTAISAAFGMAAARDLRGGMEKTIAIVGDGAMTGGEAYEALNNAGRSGKDFTVILNDNEMSIAANVGALSRHLNDIRTAPRYVATKRGVERFLRRLPLVGEGARRFVENAKNKIRYIMLPGVLFEEMGFNYIGPVDGHDLESLIAVMQNMKQMRGPLILHVATKKGKGYPKAEREPQKYHGVADADARGGGGVTYSDVFGKTMLELGCERQDVVAVTASMLHGTGLARFAEAFPDRCFDVGIAEGHAVTFAAGMAKSGFKPVVAIYSTFLQRAYDQILHDVCIQNLPVVFAIDRGGVVGADGETHQGIFDLSYLSHMPNMAVLAPKNARELADMLRWALKAARPVAVRYPRGEVSRCFDDFSGSVAYGGAETLAEGERVAIVAVGAMAERAGAVRARLARAGINAALVNARFVSPIDTRLIEKFRDFEHVFTIEENVARGGFGEALSAIFAAAGAKARVRVMALPNAFIPQGGREQLLARAGLDADGIYQTIADTLNGQR